MTLPEEHFTNMDQKITKEEAFRAMVLFLERYHERGNHADTLQNVLDDISQTFWADSPNDPAQWSDWLDAVDSIINHNQHTPKMPTNAKKAKRLREKTMFLKIIMEHYSTKDQEVAKLLDRMRPLFTKIESHQIEPPILGEYNVFDFSGEYHDYNLKYPIISIAAAHFASTLEDWDMPFPADERDTNALLKERIQPFITTLNKYAKNDQYTQMLLTEITPLLTAINNNNLRPPIANTHNWWFTDKTSPLFNKYLDLTEAAIIFDGYLEDEWLLSVNREKFLASL